MTKNLVSGPILAHYTQRSAVNFLFFKNLATSATRCHGQLSSCTISEKNNDPILRKLSDGRTDRRTDGQRDEQKRVSNFIGYCPTKVERPILFKNYQTRKSSRMENLTVVNVRKY